MVREPRRVIVAGKGGAGDKKKNLAIGKQSGHEADLCGFASDLLGLLIDLLPPM